LHRRIPENEMNDSPVRELARRAGIAVQWTDRFGKRHRVSLDTIRRILAALQLPCQTPDDIRHSRRALDNTTVPPLITATLGRAIDLPWRRPDAPPCARLIRNDGAATDVPVRRTSRGVRLQGVKAMGYHTLEIGQARLTLAVAPARCIGIADIADRQRLAGVAVQIYGLRHGGDCGIGDMSGVTALAQAAAARGLESLALSPVHAAFAVQRGQFSPYSPSNRLFYNPLHADAASVFGAERIARVRTAAGLDPPIRELESSSVVDWEASTRAKMAVLSRLFEDFAATDLAANPAVGLAADFAGFCSDCGASLQKHALFEALHQARLKAAPEQPDWNQWPAIWRDSRSAAVGEFTAQNRREILFHCFLQWLADRSFANAQQKARSAGMTIGLIADLAVGMSAAGSYAWAHNDHVLSGLQIGAPPDLFNANGQNWGLTTLSPRALQTQGYGPFIATLRACMRHAGGLRVDHAMGFKRLWAIPQGATAAEGAYIAYPVSDLFRLTALESHRHRAIVIGEDLGTVPAGFRERLARAGIYGMSVLWFARNGKGFVPPDDWPNLAVAMTSTHDLPTVAGWWRGTDLDARAGCGLLHDAQAERLVRSSERDALWAAFKSAKVAEGKLPAATEATHVVDAAVRFVATTPSQLALLPLEDVLGLERQPNMPGTIAEYPNWRLRYDAEAASMLDETSVRYRIARLANRGA
jgi:4-alpha-glucanotransferase